jgi:hypothetical protein
MMSLMSYTCMLLLPIYLVSGFRHDHRILDPCTHAQDVFLDYCLRFNLQKLKIHLLCQQRI